MLKHHLIITGGSGYIGSRLVSQALSDGRRVTLLGRRPGPADTRHVPWSLGDALPADALDPALAAGDQALIHLAHDWHADEAQSVAATALLFAGAHNAGIAERVFISSQSARADALNRYGRLKWTTEQQIAAATALRVGLVYGGPRRAMYGLLCKLAALPLLPMIEPQRKVQPIHLDEVVAGILAAADGRARGVLALAGPQEIAFGDLLRSLTREYYRRSLPIVPVPLGPALLACDLTARLPLIPTIDRERVLGLAGTEPIVSAADLAKLGICVQPIAERLHNEPCGRRARLAEARALLRYIGIAPTPALLRRYVRAVPHGPLALPRLGLPWLEPVGRHSALARRMRVAARIVEASAPGEAMLANGSRFSRILHLVLGGIFELLLLPARVVAGHR